MRGGGTFHGGICHGKKNSMKGRQDFSAFFKE